MNTTPDVDIRRGNKPQCFGLTATALPEANCSQTGGVGKNSMDNFIKLTSIDDEHILLIDEVNGTYKQGEFVRIVDGTFKGIEGRVTKITGQKRVIVELPGLCSVATAYIPKCFLRHDF